MTYFIKIIAASGLAIALGACTTTGNMERNAATGAAIGAVAGAVIGNNVGDGDAATGAAIGAIVGGAGGAYAGYKQDQAKTEQYGKAMYYDQAANRYFWVDQQTGRTYWENGDVRT